MTDSWIKASDAFCLLFINLGMCKQDHILCLCHYSGTNESGGDPEINYALVVHFHFALERSGPATLVPHIIYKGSVWFPVNLYLFTHEPSHFA